MVGKQEVGPIMKTAEWLRAANLGRHGLKTTRPFPTGTVADIARHRFIWLPRRPSPPRSDCGVLQRFGRRVSRQGSHPVPRDSALLLGLIFHEQVGELLLKRVDFWAVADLDVRFVRIIVGVILVIIFRAVEGFERSHLGHDLLGKHPLLVQLDDVGLRQALLLVVGVEDGGAIRRTHIGPLPVQLSGIVRHRKVNPQERSVSDAGRVEDYLYRLGMPGCLGDYLPIGGRLLASACVPCGGGNHALYALEHRLHAPEAASSEDRRLLAGLFGQRHLDRKRGNGRSGSDSGGCEQNAGGKPAKNGYWIHWTSPLSI